ncbi:MAG TPA: zf-HC2 domain-containing protein [Pyrinomonadaceae bacterium]|nr:zf-HC2 domain-containing protein [Pyrinomonadaceae bacterium]
MATVNKICSRDHIAAFVDDELDAGQRAAFEEHVRACRECAEEVAIHRTFMRELDTALADRFELEVPSDFARVVAVHAENDMRGVRDRSEHRRALRYCIIIGLIAFALLGVAASRGILTNIQLFLKTGLSIVALVGKTIYDAIAGLAVVSRVFRRGLGEDAGGSDFAILSLFVLAIGLLTLLLSRYRRTRVLD